MDTYNPYDLASALESAQRAAIGTGAERFVVQTPVGYQVCKSVAKALYLAWRVSPEGGITAVSLVA